MSRARSLTSAITGVVIASAVLTQPLARNVVCAQAAEASSAYNSAQYKELVQRALQEYDLGHWSEARVFFAKAHELAPNARTLRGLALVSYESRRYVDAIRFGEQALTNRVQPLTETLRAQLQEFIDQARSFVGQARINTRPGNAELRVDGVVVQRDSDGLLTLDPGTHELVVIAAGYEAQTRTLGLESGGEVRFDIVLKTEAQELAVSSQAEPDADTANLATAQTRERSEQPSRGSSVAPWIVIGASTAVLIGGGVMLGLGSADKAKVENVAKGTPYSEVKSAAERAPTLLTIGWVLAGAGLAGVAAGLTWKLWPESDHGRERARLSVAPDGLVLSGRF
jgi:PEGA domain